MKKNAGEKATEWVKNGMLVGLGTGSTVYYFIEKLIKDCQKGLEIQVVSSSLRSYDQAKKGGIPTLKMDEITQIDLTVDGADEIDSQKRMIKGGGGALLREKIVANASHEMLVIVDETKVCETLGNRALPVEILPFGYGATINKIHLLGFHGKIRTSHDEKFYVTDNGNYIYDITFQEVCIHPEEVHEKLSRIPGVLETGFFFNLAKQVIVGHRDGSLSILD